jgi:hypothetical protein
MERTGNVVTATGLHTHPTYHWLAGSPDGFVGDEGMVEVKCPYYGKRDGSSRVHKEVPGHYWMQMNALLEITQREWCDYVCWAPEGMAVYRVYRDATTFDYLCQYYSTINAAIKALAKDPPPLSKEQKEEIANKIQESMRTSVDLKFWVAEVSSQPPEREHSDLEDSDGDSLPPAKRMRLSEPRSEGEISDTTDSSASETVCCNNSEEAQDEAAKALLTLRDTQIQV